MTAKDMMACEILPSYNETWVFIADSDMAKQLYLNPSLSCTPFNILSSLILGKTHAMLGRVAVQFANMAAHHAAQYAGTT
jgi:hypothetical protein